MHSVIFPFAQKADICLKSIVCKLFISKGNLITAVDTDFLIGSRSYRVDERAVSTILVNNIGAAAAVHDDCMETADCCVVADAVVNAAALTTNLELILIDYDRFAGFCTDQCAIIFARKKNRSNEREIKTNYLKN